MVLVRRISSVMIALNAVSALAAWPAMADVQQTVGNAAGVGVRGRLVVPNNTGAVANDLHFYVYQHDRTTVTVNGATISHQGPFDSAVMNLQNRNGKPNPPPGMHGCEVTLRGGDVDPGQSVEIEVELWLSSRNLVLVDDVYWTYNGIPLPGPAPLPRGGWRVERPYKAAPETDYHHIVCIENEGDDPALLVELKLYPTMVYYEDPATEIDWGSVEPIHNEAIPPEPPVTIPPHGRWCYAVHLPGPSYVGGHVYLDYTMEHGALRSPVATFGDHPVDELCGDPACMGHDLPPVGKCILADGSCISDLYEYDCEENMDGYWLEGRECGSTTDLPGPDGWAIRIDAVHPNPFGRQTCVEFAVPADSWIDIGVHDAGGRRIATLHSGSMDAGRHVATWDAAGGGSPVPGGSYWLVFRSPRGVEARKLVIVR